MDVNMTDPKELLLQVLRDKDAGRARSKQTQVGPSELGGCRRKVWYRLNDQPETNDNELKLSAIMGTAIHAEIEKAISTADPKGEKYWVETSVEYNGMKAHIDLYIPETGDVIDWKTVKVKNLSYFPSLQQRWQVQVYGYLLDKSPERDQSYCKFYCKYFDESGEMGCTGLKKERIKEDEVFIDNPEVDTSALKYLQLDAKIKELTTERESLKAALEGFTGSTNSGVSITWSTVSGRESVDTEEVEKLLGFVPKKQGQESTRLSVKHTGGK
ncbi:MAG: hypothetical protein EB080_04230 [Burkholderiaceae bacterium]|nr:hypothetical protein [Burkholderiaceae bacterium]